MKVIDLIISKIKDNEEDKNEERKVEVITISIEKFNELVKITDIETMTRAINTLKDYKGNNIDIDMGQVYELQVENMREV